MGVCCCAFAAATEASERTFAAIAALIGSARFALTSDIAVRSGSASSLSASSSLTSRPQGVSNIEWFTSLGHWCHGYLRWGRQPLNDRCCLLRVARGGRRLRNEPGDVPRPGGHGEEVAAEQLHRRPFGQRLDHLRLQ